MEIMNKIRRMTHWSETLLAREKSTRANVFSQSSNVDEGGGIAISQHSNSFQLFALSHVEVDSKLTCTTVDNMLDYAFLQSER